MKYMDVYVALDALNQASDSVQVVSTDYAKAYELIEHNNYEEQYAAGGREYDIQKFSISLDTIYYIGGSSDGYVSLVYSTDPLVTELEYLLYEDRYACTDCSGSFQALGCTLPMTNLKEVLMNIWGERQADKALRFLLENDRLDLFYEMAALWEHPLDDIAEYYGLANSTWWAKEKGVVIMDPDGWDRRNYEFSFQTELIDEDEFDRRLSTSTILMHLKHQEV